jgi:glycosyltransferase involved in cell wall biosynthesis
MHSAKPVITCTDSGAPLEFVLHDCTGFTAEPSEEGVAEVISTIAHRPHMAAEMGRAGRARLEELNITWPTTVETLTA